MNLRVLTLCMIYDDSRILLGMKKRGFGAGKWNGFGGKVDKGEKILEAALRECKEEANISVLDIMLRGILRFTFEETDEVMEVHLFSGSKISGVIEETDEMRPEWFPRTAIPYGTMWADDPYWLPLILQGKNVEGRFHFKDFTTLIDHNVQEKKQF